MTACLSAPADTGHPENRHPADVQSLWRRRGWRPPSEYRQDFEQSCRPAIYSGLVRLTPGRVG
jgi:hypothetical protein